MKYTMEQYLKDQAEGKFEIKPEYKVKPTFQKWMFIPNCPAPFSVKLLIVLFWAFVFASIFLCFI
jgi:hypothetical protein